MFKLSCSLKAGLCVALLAGLALPVFANSILSDTPYLDQSAIEMIENTVARIVANDLQNFYGLNGAPGCIETADRAYCIDPDTPRERMEEILRSLPTWEGEEGDRYIRDGRWTMTASGYAGIMGDPITLTYSFLPDGTWIPSEGTGSLLYARLNAQFGSEAAWKQIFQEIFARWQEVTGLTYIEENDDGGTFNSSPGVLGIRGDVRIGMANIDGYSGTLAYNWYPNAGGDMVMDYSENWHNGLNDYRFLRNVVLHEHGHGHGLGHCSPINGTKLMEAYYNGGFYGPQDDDIRGGMRNYGDYREKNTIVADATDLGTLAEGAYSDTYLCLHSSGDTDYYLFNLATGMLLNIYVTPTGSYYQIDSGYIHTAEVQDLGFEIYASDGTTLLLAVNDGGFGVVESTLNLDLAAGDYYLRVRRHNGSNDVQRYDLDIDLTISDLTAVGDGDVPIKGLGMSVFPTPFNPKTTARFYAQQAGAVSLEVFNVQGRVVRRFDETAAGAGWMDISWNGRNDSGQNVPSGLYFLRAHNGGQSETVRALLLK